MSFNDVPLIAGGNISPARFCTLSAAANNTALESNSGDTAIIGVSTEATKNAQTGGSTYAAEDGDSVRIHQFGEDCLLTLGVGGCAARDFLKPDNDGKGVTAVTTNVAGALALEAGSADEKVHVLVLPPTYVP